MVDIIQILNNLQSALDPLERLITGGAYIAGLLLITRGLFEFRSFANQRAYYRVETSAFRPLSKVGVGAILLFLPDALSTFLTSVYGYNTPLAYNNLGEVLSQQYLQIQPVVLRIVQVLGMYWFIHGWILMIKDNQEERSHLFYGLAYVIGGILAINVRGTFDVLSATATLITNTLHKAPSS